MSDLNYTEIHNGINVTYWKRNTNAKQKTETTAVVFFDGWIDEEDYTRAPTLPRIRNMRVVIEVDENINSMFIQLAQESIDKYEASKVSLEKAASENEI